ncbi:MAG: nucleotidyl transferase AbiEii/AbiGii toxin family protein [Ilumatobacteraceae bacterium]
MAALASTCCGLTVHGATARTSTTCEEPSDQRTDLRRTPSGRRAGWLRQDEHGSRSHPKARLHSTFVSGTPMRVKVEMNTFERSPARRTTTRPLTVDSTWFTGSADVPTFEGAELAATEIRAIYQRSKGRDLFDLWLAVTQAGLDPREIAECFHPYRPDNWSTAKAHANLDAKLADPTFVTDIESLLANRPVGYSIDAAADVVRPVIDAVDDGEREAPDR